MLLLEYLGFRLHGTGKTLWDETRQLHKLPPMPQEVLFLDIVTGRLVLKKDATLVRNGKIKWRSKYGALPCRIAKSLHLCH